MARVWRWSMLALALAACFEPPDTTACVTHTDCFPTELCTDARCVPSGGGETVAEWPYRECGFDLLAYPQACGDGVCDLEYGESQSTCWQDCDCGDGLCDPSELGRCGQCQGACDFDTVCDDGEEAGSCSDCPTCGDALCELGEGVTCPDDCGTRRAPPLAIFYNAVRAERGEFFLANDTYSPLGGDLSPGQFTVYDVYPGQSVRIDFGRADGGVGYRTEVQDQGMCWDRLQLVAGTEDSQGRIGIQTFAGLPDRYRGEVGFARVVNLSDRFSPLTGNIDGDAMGGQEYSFGRASGWLELSVGPHRLGLVDRDGGTTDWSFDIQGGELVFLGVRDHQGGPMGLELEVDVVRTGKLGL